MSRYVQPVVVIVLVLVTIMSMSCGPSEPAAPVQPSEPPVVQATEEPTKVPTPPTPKVLTVAQGVDALSLDPAADVSTSADRIYDQIYDQLVMRDEDLRIQPSLATEWRVIDDATWEFDLQEGVLFHNGQELTADDVVYSIERMLDENNNFSQTPNVAVAIAGAEAVDQHTVRIFTNGPQATMLSRLLYIWVVPKAVVEEMGDEAFGQKAVGSGPFAVVSWEPDTELVLEAFDDYWRGRPKLDQLVFRPITEESARVASLLTGEVDIIVNVPPHMASQIEEAEGVSIATVPSMRVMFVGMMNENPPLDDIRVRQALNYAVDKRALIEQVLDGQAMFHGKMMPEQVFGYDPSLPQPYPYDPEKAKQLLAEAGFADGLTLKFDGPRGRYMKDAELAEAIAYQLKQVGVDTELTLQEWGTFWPRMVGKEVENLFFLGLGNSLVDMEYYLSLYLSSRGRGFFYPPEEIEDKIDKQAATVDQAEREKLLQELMADYHELAPWIFLWNQLDFYGQSDRVINWQPSMTEMLHFVETDIVQ
ncbi:ABC transporter substrate-binding protein [Chloroflexota bacterium]